MFRQESRSCYQLRFLDEVPDWHWGQRSASVPRLFHCDCCRLEHDENYTRGCTNRNDAINILRNKGNRLRDTNEIERRQNRHWRLGKILTDVDFDDRSISALIRDNIVKEPSDVSDGRYVCRLMRNLEVKF